MKRVIFLLSAVWLLMSCTKDEDNEVSPSRADRDWFVVEDLPGEFNQLRYELYRDYGLTVLMSDTLGQEVREYDAYGNPMVHTEIYNFCYSVYSDNGMEDYSYACTKDSSVVYKAMTLLKEKVCPYLPQDKVFCPKIVFFVDSLLWEGSMILGHAPCKCSMTTYVYAAQGIPIGGLVDLKDEDINGDKWLRIAGIIWGFNAMDWITNRFEEETDEWYGLTPTMNGMTLYENGKYLEIGSTYNCWNGQTPEEFGFFGWQKQGIVTDFIGKEHDAAVTPSKNDDLLEYIARYFMYRGREDEFQLRYQDAPIILQKMEALVPLIHEYEQVMGIEY